jgi:hypothetical protein
MPSSRVLPHWFPRIATVLGAVLTSIVTSAATVPIALWALRPPHQMHRLWLALSACLGAIMLGGALGRALARTAIRWTERRCADRRRAARVQGADRRRGAVSPA